MNKLPAGSEIHRLRTNPENPLTLAQIAERYEASRQAVHKAHKRWAEQNGVEWRTRPVRSAGN